MHPYFLFKDLVTIFLFFLILSLFVFYMPNALGHSDNYIPANPMQTPPSIYNTLYYVCLAMDYLIKSIRLNFVLFMSGYIVLRTFLPSHILGYLDFWYTIYQGYKFILYNLVTISAKCCRSLLRSLFLLPFAVITISVKLSKALSLLSLSIVYNLALSCIRYLVSSTSRFISTETKPIFTKNLPNPQSSALFILSNGTPITIEFSELMSRITSQFKSAEELLKSHPLSGEAYLEFQQLVNGFTQAEGHWGGYITNTSTLTFRPIFFVSQNAGDQSLLFFAKISAVLPGVFTYTISITDGGFYHIRLQCRDWNKILSDLIPYMCMLYGEKFTAMAKLQSIFNLQNSTSIGDRTKMIWLIYNLTTADNAVRQVPFLDMLKLVNNHLSAQPLAVLPDYNALYPNNTCPMSFMFFFGMFIGDGNIYIRIREVSANVQFIPILRLPQKATGENISLITMITSFLQSLGVSARVSTEGPNVMVKIEGLNAFSDSFMSLLSSNSCNGFWKMPQLQLLTNVIKLMNIKPKSWLEAQLAILNTVYTHFSNRDYPLSYWVDKLTSSFSDLIKTLPAGTTYISLTKFTSGPNKGSPKSWMVKLPLGLNLRPREKHFVVSVPGGSDAALASAIKYRNDTLAKCLNDLGF